MKFETGIPEKDRVCINCMYFGRHMDDGDEYKCHGTMPCSNYHKDNTQNYFVPDDLYLQTEYGCEACEFYYGGEQTEECTGCSRWYEDRWSRQKGEFDITSDTFGYQSHFATCPAASKFRKR